MTLEQQRIAIAEACGWFFMDDSWHYPNGAKAITTPDYLNDLNAMHEAEKMLTEHQWDEYERVLRLVCDGCSYYEGAGKELLHATTSQRAEAFLKTLKLWKP